MKTTLLALGMLALGVALGSGTTWFETHNARDHFRPTNQQLPKLVEKKSLEKPADEDKPQGKIELLDGTSFDFGTMERHSTLSHTFHVKNVGEIDAILDLGKRSCRCTVSDLNTAVLPPGEVAEIEMTWNTKTLEDKASFRQYVELHTNDPDHDIVRFYISGLITDNLRAVPKDCAVNNISANDQTTSEFRLYNFKTDELKIEKAEFTDAETLEFFDIRFEPLTAEELAVEEGAQSGLRAIVTIKAGMQMGPINQALRLETNLGEAGRLMVPILGTVSSDILISGKGYDRDDSVLGLGNVDGGHEEKLFLVVKGPLRDEVQVRVAAVEPAEALQVELEPPRGLGGGRTVMHVLRIRVMQTEEPTVLLGPGRDKMGKILLETTHSQAKQVPIYVSFGLRE